MANGNFKFLEHIASKVVGIILLTIAVMGFLYSIKSDIAKVSYQVETIKTNHLVHIDERIDGVITKNDYQDEELNLIKINMAKILTILEK